MQNMFHGLLGSASGGGGGGAYPNLNFSSPQWTTTGQKFGSGALLGQSGSATASITLLDNGNGSSQTSFSLGFWYKSSDTGNFTGSGGNLIGFGTDIAVHVDSSGGNTFTGMFNNTVTGGVNVRDGAWHWITWTYYEDFGYDYGLFSIDTTSYRNINGASPLLFTAGTRTLTIDTSVLNAGDAIDDIVVYNNEDLPVNQPVAEFTRDGNTNVIWHLNGNGTGT